MEAGLCSSKSNILMTISCSEKLKSARSTPSFCLTHQNDLDERSKIPRSKSLNSCAISPDSSIPAQFCPTSINQNSPGNIKLTAKIPVKTAIDVKFEPYLQEKTNPRLKTTESESNLLLASKMPSCSITRWNSTPSHLFTYVEVRGSEEPVDKSSVKSDLPNFFSASTDSLTSSVSSQITVPSDSDLSKNGMLPGARRRRRVHSESENDDEYSQCSSGKNDDSSSYYSESIEPEATQDLDLSNGRPSEISNEIVALDATDHAPKLDTEDSTNLDADKDKTNPAYVPRVGRFYMHDQRLDECHVETQEDRKEKDNNRRWQHDKFNYYDQAPKSTSEIIRKYGYNIREKQEHPSDNDGCISSNFSDVLSNENTTYLDTSKSSDYDPSNIRAADVVSSVRDGIRQNTRQRNPVPRRGSHSSRFTTADRYTQRVVNNHEHQTGHANYRSGYTTRSRGVAPGYNRRSANDQGNGSLNSSTQRYSSENDDTKIKNHSYSSADESMRGKTDETHDNSDSRSVHHQNERQSDEYDSKVDERGDRRFIRNESHHINSVNVPKRYSEYRQKVSSHSKGASVSSADYPSEVTKEYELSSQNTHEIPSHFDSPGRRFRVDRFENETGNWRRASDNRNEEQSFGMQFTRRHYSGQHEPRGRKPTSESGHYVHQYKADMGYRGQDQLTSDYCIRQPYTANYSSGRNRYNEGRPLLGGRTQMVFGSRDPRHSSTYKQAIDGERSEFSNQNPGAHNAYIHPTY